MENLEQKIIDYLKSVKFDGGLTYNQIADKLDMPNKWKDVSKACHNLIKFDVEPQLIGIRKDEKTKLFKYCPEKYYFKKINKPQLLLAHGKNLSLIKMKMLCNTIKQIILSKPDENLGKNQLRKLINQYMGGIDDHITDSALDFGAEIGMWQKVDVHYNKKIAYHITNNVVDTELAESLILTSKYNYF